MKKITLIATITGTVFAGGAFAGDISLLENCLKLQGVMEDAKSVFTDDHNPDQRVQFLPGLNSDFRIYGQVTKIAGGPEAKAVLESFEAEEPSAITGHVFAVPVTNEIAQCKLSKEDKHSCGPIYTLLEKTAAALVVACANDYQKANN